MNRRALIIGLLVVVSLAALIAVVNQSRQLSEVRARQRQLLAQLASETSSSNPSSAADDETRPGAAPVSPELLRLRSEVTRLTARRNELAGASSENERLRTQIASAQTNRSQGLPAGYLRKSDARMVGYNTPEDTIQSLLWGLQQKDTASFIQAFAPATAQLFEQRISSSPQAKEEFLRGMQALVGMAIVHREQLPDGQVELQILVAPDMPPASLSLQSINGQWKITSVP